MSKKLQLKIVTPEKLILEELVDLVTIPTTEGEITILPDHIPLVASLASGDIVAQNDGEHIPMGVVGGFVETKKDGDVTTVTILADFAEHIGDITEEEIEKAKAKAEELRKQAENNEIVDFEHFETELERSLNRIKIADKWRTKKYRK
ncbi:MAG: ATP synthase F1 subunit epsilon [Candidatus Paceibacterota bacterium]|jgi:F-type H+-transporting ATPase subunit epsilon